MHVTNVLVCGLLSGGVLALISDQPLPSAVNDIISAARLPVLSTSTITTDTNSTVVSIAPSEEQLAGALSILIKHNLWTEVILLTWQGSGISSYVAIIKLNKTILVSYIIPVCDLASQNGSSCHIIFSKFIEPKFMISATKEYKFYI